MQPTVISSSEAGCGDGSQDSIIKYIHDFLGLCYNSGLPVCPWAESQASWNSTGGVGSTDCYQIGPSQLVGIHATLVVWYFEYHLSLSDNPRLLNFERLSTIVQSNQFLGRSDYCLHLKFKIFLVAAHWESSDGPVKRTRSRVRAQVRPVQHLTVFSQLPNNSKTHDKTRYNSRTFRLQHTTDNISDAT